MARGGKRENAGRKSKADELKVRKLGIDAIESVYGSVEDYYKFIAKESKESFPHLKLLQEYVFGKPKETVDTNVSLNNITLSDLVKFGDDK
jgi:hypothetical protein